MKKLSQLLESINEIDSLMEIDFKDKESFQKYQAKHQMRPSTKVNIAGKETTVGDEMGDDSQTPQAPKKTTGADIEKQASKSGKKQDNIEKGIMGNEPKLDPKVKQRAQDNYNDAINNIKNPQMAGGIEPYYVDMAADNLEKLGNPDAKVFKDLGKEFRDNLDDDGNPKDEKLDKQIQDKIKLAALDLETDITKDVGTEIKDGKIKSSGPQQFTDDVKNIKGEYDLGGGVKIKDGKMFDADGEEMDDDDIDDFYYQDAYDEDGNNVGIDISSKNENFDLRQLSKITTRYTNRLDEAGVPNHLRAGFKKLKNEEGLSIEEKDELTDAYRKLVDLLTYGKFYENGRPNQRRKELSELTFDIQYALVGSKRLKPQNSQSKFESIWKKFTNMINTQIKIEEKGKQGNYRNAIRASKLDDVVDMFKRNTQRSTRKQKDLL